MSLPPLAVELRWRPRHPFGTTESTQIEWRGVVGLSHPQAQAINYLLGKRLGNSVEEAETYIRERLSKTFEIREIPIIREEGESFGPRLANEGDHGTTGGSMAEDGLVIEWGGCVPVQGHGTLDGYSCYYRARGNGWRLEVDTGPADAIWEFGENPYVWPEAGYIHCSETEKNLRQAVKMWKARTPVV